MPIMPVKPATHERASEFIKSIRLMFETVEEFNKEYKKMKMTKADTKIMDKLSAQFKTAMGELPQVNDKGDAFVVDKPHECCLLNCGFRGRLESPDEEWYCVKHYKQYVDEEEADEYEEEMEGIQTCEAYLELYRQAAAPVKEFIVPEKVLRTLPALNKSNIYEKNGKRHCVCPLCDCEMTVRHYQENHNKVLNCEHVKKVRVSDVEKYVAKVAEEVAVVVPVTKEKRKYTKKAKTLVFEEPVERVDEPIVVVEEPKPVVVEEPVVVKIRPKIKIKSKPKVAKPEDSVV